MMRLVLPPRSFFLKPLLSSSLSQTYRSAMSWRGKRKDSDTHASGDESDGAAPPKKAPKNDSDDTDSIVVCEISKNRRVSVRSWQGKVVVDIREFYLKDGKQMPGKKGITLSMDQWKMLKEHVGEIDQAVAENA